MWLWDLLSNKEKAKSYNNDRPAFISTIKDNQGYSSFLADIIKTNKEVNSMPTNEYVDGFLARKTELETEKLALEGANIEALVQERFEKVREEIKQQVLNEHNAKIEDINVEIRAIDRLIQREIAKLEKEQQEQEEIVEE